MKTTSTYWKRTGALMLASLAVGATAGYVVYRQHTPSEGHIPLQRARGIAYSTPIADAHLQAVDRMQRQPLYQQAQAACSHREYRRAADLLGRLAREPQLSTEESDFLQQQRNICLRDAGAPVPPTKPRHPVFTPRPSPPNVEQADCGPRSLLLVCNQLGMKTTLKKLCALAGTTDKGTSLTGLAKAAQSLGLKAEGVQVSREALPDVETPALAYVNGNHYVALLGLHGGGQDGTATLHDPNLPQEETVSQERLLRLSSGYLLLVHR